MVFQSPTEDRTLCTEFTLPRMAPFIHEHDPSCLRVSSRHLHGLNCACLVLHFGLPPPPHVRCVSCTPWRHAERYVRLGPGRMATECQTIVLPKIVFYAHLSVVKEASGSPCLTSSPEHRSRQQATMKWFSMCDVVEIDTDRP